MKISLITPAHKASRTGNRTTADRWARILRSLGHRVRVATRYDVLPADVMIALHAWRSADSIRAYRARYAQRPLIVGLGGTDVYRFQQSEPEVTRGSMALADMLVGLHDLVGEAIPAEMRGKLRVIHQSAPKPRRRLPPLRDVFEVLVIGHLRDEKDPLRSACAARELPSGSRIRVVHLGMAYDARWSEAAHTEMAENPRYRWLGEVPGWRVRRALARAPLMVLSSVMEGGANVISEAIAAGGRCWRRRSRARSDCSGAPIPATFRCGTRRRWRRCCIAPKPIPNSSPNCDATARNARRCSIRRGSETPGATFCNR